jgi:hypothetical protein
MVNSRLIFTASADVEMSARENYFPQLKQKKVATHMGVFY